MQVVDDAVLALLRAAVPPVSGDDRVHDGYVPTTYDAGAKIITAVLPYLAYFSSLGDDSNRRMSGPNGRRSVFFQVTYVGDSREQAKLVGARQRAALRDKRISLPGRNSWPIILGESQRIRRDDDAARPDGSPLFYGVDLYSVAVTIQPTE